MNLGPMRGPGGGNTQLSMTAQRLIKRRFSLGFSFSLFVCFGLAWLRLQRSIFLPTLGKQE